MDTQADSERTEPPHARVAVIGAGPSGLYTVLALLESQTPVSVDVFDRLPAPYGLVRYGVAPDQVKMKSVTRVLQRPFSANDVQFFGNVAVGKDLSHEQLCEHYQAVVYATGTQSDRRLGIPGEDLAGSVGAATFVKWYSGHPDVAERDFVLDSPEVAVVGAGNVALDVARVLAKSSKEMADTDVPDRVLAELDASRVRDIHLLIRRGPAQVKFTPPELRLMGQLSNAEVVVHDHGLDDEPEASPDRRVRQNLELLREWAQRDSEGKPRRVHLRFFRSPVEVLGSDRVRGLVIERTALAPDGRLVGTGEHETLDVGMVLRSVGYRAQPLPGLPFDAQSGTVPHEAGRVLDDGRTVPGVYVAGWAKRGPTGVIGTNKGDGAETARSVVADLPRLQAPARPHRTDLVELLSRRGVRYVDWDSWLRLDSHESELGEGSGRGRVKLPDLASMLAACLDTEPAPPGER